MEGLELIAFQVIASVGTARSMYVEAITLAKKGQIKEAKEMIHEGSLVFNEGHHAHMELITMEANGELPNIPLLIMHAEDQLMSAETLKIIADEFIDLYEQVGASK